MRRRTLTGRSMGPSATRDIKTTKRSNMFLQVFVHVVPEFVLQGGVLKRVKEVRPPAVGYERGEPVGVQIDEELAREDGCEEGVEALQN
jgi:hypothetical protein